MGKFSSEVRGLFLGILKSKTKKAALVAVSPQGAGGNRASYVPLAAGGARVADVSL